MCDSAFLHFPTPQGEWEHPIPIVFHKVTHVCILRIPFRGTWDAGSQLNSYRYIVPTQCRSDPIIPMAWPRLLCNAWCGCSGMQNAGLGTRSAPCSVGFHQRSCTTPLTLAHHAWGCCAVQVVRYSSKSSGQRIPENQFLRTLVSNHSGSPCHIWWFDSAC